MKATFHGHACFVVERDEKRVIIDPFLTGNPAALIGPDQLPRLARAVEFVKPKSVIPMHYNTWDLISADPQEFRRLVGKRAAVTILSPGESYTLS